VRNIYALAGIIPYGRMPSILACDVRFDNVIETLVVNFVRGMSAAVVFTFQNMTKMCHKYHAIVLKTLPLEGQQYLINIDCLDECFR